jgi:hypothetical protein
MSMVSLVGMIFGGKTEELEERLAPVPLCQPQIHMD